MTATGLTVFDKTIEKSHLFINDVAKELRVDDKQKVFEGLRATLHALRDRIPAGEAAQLGSQLPILLAGFYYEGWRPGAAPTKERHKDAFFTNISQRIQNKNSDAEYDIEQLVRGVFSVLASRVSTGEIEEVVGILPAELKDLWPQAVQA